MLKQSERQQHRETYVRACCIFTGYIRTFRCRRIHILRCTAYSTHGGTTLDDETKVPRNFRLRFVKCQETNLMTVRGSVTAIDEMSDGARESYLVHVGWIGWETHQEFRLHLPLSSSLYVLPSFFWMEMHGNSTREKPAVQLQLALHAPCGDRFR